MSNLNPQLPDLIRVTFLSRNPMDTLGGVDYERKKVDGKRGDRRADGGKRNFLAVARAFGVTVFDLISDLEKTHRVVAIFGDTSDGRKTSGGLKFRTTVVWLRNGVEQSGKSSSDPLDEWVSEIEEIFYPAEGNVFFHGVYVYINDGSVTINLPKSPEASVFGQPLFDLTFSPGQEHLEHVFNLYPRLPDGSGDEDAVTARVTHLATYGWRQVSQEIYRTLKAGNTPDLEVLQEELRGLIWNCKDKPFEKRLPHDEEIDEAVNYIDLQRVLDQQTALWQSVQARRAAKRAEKEASAAAASS